MRKLIALAALALALAAAGANAAANPGNHYHKGGGHSLADGH